MNLTVDMDKNYTSLLAERVGKFNQLANRDAEVAISGHFGDKTLFGCL